MIKVLVVEDDPDLLFLYNTALAQNSIETISAKKAETAIIELNKQAFDAAIIDLNLPDAHGTVILDYLLQQKQDMLEKIIVITANDLSIDDVTNRGVKYTLVKPVSMGEVVQLIEEIADL